MTAAEARAQIANLERLNAQVVERGFRLYNAVGNEPMRDTTEAHLQRRRQRITMLKDWIARDALRR